MFYVTQFPVCPATQTLLQQLMLPNPMIWLSFVLIFSSFVFMSKSKWRTGLATVMIFSGNGLLIVPTANMLLSPVLYCDDIQKIQRLETVFPVMNFIAIAAIVICVFGVLYGFHQMFRTQTGKVLKGIHK